MALQNTENSSSSDSTTSKSFFSTAPSTLKKSGGFKMQYQYESVYIPENQRFQDVLLSDINLYKALTKPSTSFFKSVKTFFKPSEKIKESVVVTAFQEYPIPSGDQERFITLKIEPYFPASYTYLHVGAIRLALTFHNRKGLPVASRIALLDSRFKNYQHACLGIVETTLNAGTVVVTLYPNFTVSLKDKTLSTAFLVQIQVVGASMDPGLIQATLHSQMAYRVQDHVFGLGLASYGDIPLIQIDSKNSPMTIHIPTTISRDELVSILPEVWVSNFENRRREEQTRRSTFTQNADGTLTVRYNR